MTVTTLVRHVMTQEPKTMKSSMNVCDAAGTMANFDVGVVPIVDDDHTFVGLVTDRDLVVRVLANRWDPEQVQLGDIATKSIVSVTPDTILSDAKDLMAEHRVRRLPVIKDHELVGILSLGDVALAMASKRSLGEVLEEVSESPSTEDRNVGPDPGTPDRVLEAR
jgi:CBS domain-containing protein